MNPYDDFEDDLDESLYWDDDPYEALRETLSPAYQDLPPEEIELLMESIGLSAEEMEFNLSKALSSAGKLAQTAAPAVLPLAGTVIGTAYGGPVGGALGGALGQMAGGAIAGIGQPAQAGAAAQPTAAGQTQTTAAPVQAQAPVTGQPRPATPATPPTSAATPTGGSQAAAQLVQLLTSRPEILQGLLSLALGQAGSRQTNVAGTAVPPAAFANLVAELAGQAAAESNALVEWDGEAVPGYLLDEAGYFLVDPAEPQERAARLMELLEEAAWLEADDLEDDLDEGWDDEWNEWADEEFLEDDDFYGAQDDAVVEYRGLDEAAGDW